MVGTESKKRLIYVSGSDPIRGYCYNVIRTKQLEYLHLLLQDVGRREK